MFKVKVYNKLSGKNKIAGLELPDLMVLSMLYLLIFIFSQHLLMNAVLLIAAYFFLCVYKKGKPAHFTATVLRFFLARPRYGEKLEYLDEGSTAHE